jgi:hypothetical protein
MVRHAPRHAGEREWRPADPDPDLLEGVDALIHLAGASVGGRFTPARKREIRDSRVGPTQKLAELAARAACLRHRARGGHLRGRPRRSGPGRAQRPRRRVPRRRGGGLVSADRSATARSGWPGSGSTTCSTSACVRSPTQRWPARSTRSRPNPCGTRTMLGPWAGCSPAPRYCRCRPQGRRCCSAPKGPANWRRRASGSARRCGRRSGISSGTRTWTARCATSSAVPPVTSPIPELPLARI